MSGRGRCARRPYGTGCRTMGLAVILMAGPAVVAGDEVREGAGATLPRVVATGVPAGPPARPAVYSGDLRQLPVVLPWRPGDPIKDIPRRGTLSGRLPAAGPGRPDPLVGRQLEVELRSFSEPILDVAGQGFSGAVPPDTVGDVGPSHYVQAVNRYVERPTPSWGATFTVHDKESGAVVAGPVAMESMGVGACSQGGGDPIVLWDGLAGRWLLSEFAASGSHLCVYVSQTSDPVSGGWYAYDFDVPEFPDYPKYGVWTDAYYVTTQTQFQPYSAVFALEREKMLLGQPAAFQRFVVDDLPGFGFNALTPADPDGAAPPPADAPGLLARHRDTEIHGPSELSTEDLLEVYELRVDWDDPAGSTLTLTDGVPTAEFDSTLCDDGPGTPFNCFPQPATSTRLDAVREVVMWRLQYRRFLNHESLVGNFTVDVTGTDHGGIRWFELRRSGDGLWRVHQEGTWTVDSHHRWMGSIAMDGSGNLALGYSAVSSGLYPSAGFSGRRAGDALGVLTHGETFLAVGVDSSWTPRWGDYAAMSVDPTDDCTFWFTTEYGDAQNRWNTRIASFRFDGCVDAGGLLFHDGFETADTIAWSGRVP